MDDTPRIWERQPGEPLLWHRRFERFRLMEPVRKIATVFQQEQEGTEKNGEKQRTIPPGEWYEQAKKWRWDERAAAWDALLDGEIEEQIASERKKVLRSRFALMHKRVEALNAMATQLADMSADDRNIWLKDVKAIGNGKDARQVDLVQFNEGLFREFRGFMADIAAEMGERVKRSEVSAKVQTTGVVGVYLPQKYAIEEEGGDAHAKSVDDIG